MALWSLPGLPRVWSTYGHADYKFHVGKGFAECGGLGCWLGLDLLSVVVVKTGERQKGGAGGYRSRERREENGDTERGDGNSG